MKASSVFIAIGILVLLGMFMLINNTAQNSKTTATPTPINKQSATTSPSPTPSVAELTINVTGNLAITPQTLRVQEGEEATINVTSEIADEAHLHGYDISKPVGPNQPAQIKLTANKTGRFELELEDKGITIAILEVYPK